MTYFYWITGIILALAWFSRIAEAVVGMPSVADVSRPQWDRNPVSASGNPRVSIIVPARNEQETIEQALRSLLALDYDNYEVIAVNDRSTDRTGGIMERLAGERLPAKDEEQVRGRRENQVWRQRPEVAPPDPPVLRVIHQ